MKPSKISDLVCDVLLCFESSLFHLYFLSHRHRPTTPLLS